MKKATTSDVRAEARLLQHPPGTAGHDLETWLAAERKRDAKKAATAKAKKAEDEEAQALHMAKTAHGLVKALQMLPAGNTPSKPKKKKGPHKQPVPPKAVGSHLVFQPPAKTSAVDVALENGRRWRESKLGRFRSEAYAPGLAETTGADRTQRRRP